ncbi:glutaminyl-peptide cyclotransferase [Psychromonas sp.]|uniref:glutaminyl-peptide cyclotransferase n=1 Tax=Psychromonas sp. TaxID=1884585 RepID=UPI00356ABDBB
MYEGQNNFRCKTVGRISLDGLLSKRSYSKKIDVLNGIFYDKPQRRLFVIGKYWSQLWELASV